MEILEGDALYRMLLQRYSKDPRGWSFTISPSPSNGFFDARVGSPDESWHLKLDTIYKPSPFVLGAKTDQDLSMNSPASLSFGFRRVNPQQAPALLDDSQEGMGRLLAFLSTVNPVAPTGPGSYIQGPYVFNSRGRTAGSMTREQQSVDSRLSDEMRKLVRRRYPSYL
ncbi:MAG TPA: hypothetical protein VND40_01010 [Nitrososphaerales archaeon]|nr:hypothetical protein [Nitrososphaerales archaeon]